MLHLRVINPRNRTAAVRDLLNAAIAGYVRWRNNRAKPKVNFAVNSPIRTWTDYPRQGCVTSH